MDFYDKIISDIRHEYEDRDEIQTMILTGSVARGEAYEGNDLDIIFVATQKIPFSEYRVNESLIEIGGDTLEEMLMRLEENPMYSYMYIDAKAVFDKGDNLLQLKARAQKILDNYSPTNEDKKALKKWLTSVIDKVKVARNNEDIEKVGFHISNVLWKTVEGLYMINDMPTPASTSALRRVNKLTLLPEDFETLWKQTLLGDLDERTIGTLSLISFILKQL